MLIARAPVRLGLAGGGTDLPAYYERFGGAVLSTTIDRYLYSFVNVREKESLQITSSDYQTFFRHAGDTPLLWDGDLKLPRAVLSHFGIHGGLSIFVAAEVPPGTGLGSSSAAAVVLIKAISTALGLDMDKGSIAELACHIEIDLLDAPIGKQDQYAAAFGGLNWIEFGQAGVRVTPLRMNGDSYRRLEKNLLLFFTGTTRDAARVLSQQSASSRNQDPQVIDALHQVQMMAYEARATLERGDLQAFGELLHRNWEQKKRYAHGVTNGAIDEAYGLARKAGATGGKITGAGGGGFLMLYCEEPYQPAVTRILESRGLRRMDYRFESQGARVLMNAGLSIPSIAPGRRAT